MNFTCHGCTRLFSAEDKLQLHEKSFTGTITTALQRFSTCLSDSPHELLRALLPNLHQLLQALESDFNGPLGLSLLRASLYELLQALEHTPIPCPGCEKSFESERNLRRHYRTHVYIHEECRYCLKPLKNVSQVHTHPANCPDRNGAKLTNEEFDTRQWLINHSNNRLDEERQLVRQSLKRTREEKEEGGGGDNERGVSKAKRGGSDNTCGESGGSGCEGSLPTLPHSDNLRPEQMPSVDHTARQNAVSQEIQCSSTDKNVAAAQQEAFSYRQNPLLDNGPTGGPTIITPRREATSSHNIDKISHPCPWNDTEVTAQAPSTTYGTYTEEREQQSNNWAPGVVQVPTPTNYSLVEDDIIYMQAPSLFSHPFDQFILADMLGTQHNDEITTANSLPLDEFLGYGTQHHPP